MRDRLGGFDENMENSSTLHMGDRVNARPESAPLANQINQLQTWPGAEGPSAQGKFFDTRSIPRHSETVSAHLSAANGEAKAFAVGLRTRQVARPPAPRYPSPHPASAAKSLRQ